MSVGAIRASARGAVWLIVGVFAAVLLVWPRSAAACSWTGPDLPQPAVVAEGWVERATPRPELPSGFPLDPKGAGTPHDPFVPVEVVLRVEPFLKGSAPSLLAFFDRASVRRAPDGLPVRLPDGRVSFTAGGGACGALDADPAGSYALLVGVRGDDGRFYLNRVQGAAFGAGPDAPSVRALRQDVLRRLQPAGLPRSGAPGPGGVAAGLALVAGGLLLRWRGRPRRARQPTSVSR